MKVRHVTSVCVELLCRITAWFWQYEGKWFVFIYSSSSFWCIFRVIHQKTYYSFSIVYLSPLFTPGESELSGLFSTTIHVNMTKKMPVKVLKGKVVKILVSWLKLTCGASWGGMTLHIHIKPRTEWNFECNWHNY